MIIYFMVAVVSLFLAAIWYIYITEMRIAENIKALDIKLKILLSLVLAQIEYKKRGSTSKDHENEQK